MHDILILGGEVVDPANGRQGCFDLAIEHGKVAQVAPDLSNQPAREVVRADGKWVFPGLVDPHVHVSARPEGYRMMARAGVTCALDMAGVASEIILGLRQAGAGLAVGFLYPLIPGDTVGDRDPGRAELKRVVDEALRQGALGVKVVGGHYPLTPDATALAIRVAYEMGCWCAVHAGTTTAGSTIEGLEELVVLSDGLPLHIAHVNSYCRGQITGDPLVEASRALKALARAPAARSESYLSLFNGTNGAMESGMPTSNVTATCLAAGGYPQTADGMVAAIAAGWAHVHGVRGGEMVLLPPEDGLAAYRAAESQAYVSFAVNSPSAAIALAVARSDQAFAVTALSTDGGAIPRNVTLEKGLALVRFGALSLADFVTKACLNPARMLGAESKGHVGVGADADVAVVDPVTDRAEWVFASGQAIVSVGEVVGQGGSLLTTECGQTTLSEQGVECHVVRPDWL